MATPALTDYTYKKKLSYPVTSLSLAATESDFPLCVHINASSWATEADRTHFAADNTDGKRVNFYAYDGTTRLPYEVELYNGATEAIYWVKVPSVVHDSDTNNYIWIGYGNKPEDLDQSQSTSVWDTNFKGILHLSDGTTLSVADSTGTITTVNANGTAAVAGVIGGGASFDNSDDDIALGDFTMFNSASAFTISMWFNQDVIDVYDTFFCKKGALDTYKIQIDTYTDGFMYLELTNGSASSYGYFDYSTAVSADTWTHLEVVYDGSQSTDATKLKIYINAVQKTLAFGAAIPTSMADLAGYTAYIGRYTAATANPYDGYMDEIRFSNSARSLGWIKLEYYSMKKTNWNGDAVPWVWGTEESTGATSSIKTMLGIAKASVKTVDGLAIASVKTWDGLAQ